MKDKNSEEILLLNAETLSISDVFEIKLNMETTFVIFTCNSKDLPFQFSTDVNV